MRKIDIGSGTILKTAEARSGIQISEKKCGQPVVTHEVGISASLNNSMHILSSTLNLSVP